MAWPPVTSAHRWFAIFVCFTLHRHLWQYHIIRDISSQVVGTTNQLIMLKIKFNHNCQSLEMFFLQFLWLTFGFFICMHILSTEIGGKLSIILYLLLFLSLSILWDTGSHRSLGWLDDRTLHTNSLALSLFLSLVYYVYFRRMRIKQRSKYWKFNVPPIRIRKHTYILRIQLQIQTHQHTSTEKCAHAERENATKSIWVSDRGRGRGVVEGMG